MSADPGKPELAHARIRSSSGLGSLIGATFALRKASTVYSWPSSWIGDPQNGDVIGSQPIPTLPVGGETVLEFPWTPALSGPTESKRRGRISTVYAKPHRHGIDFGSASYLGFDSRTDMPWNLSYYLGRLEDAWTQHYLRPGPSSSSWPRRR